MWSWYHLVTPCREDNTGLREQMQSDTVSQLTGRKSISWTFPHRLWLDSWSEDQNDSCYSSNTPRLFWWRDSCFYLFVESGWILCLSNLSQKSSIYVIKGSRQKCLKNKLREVLYKVCWKWKRNSMTLIPIRILTKRASGKSSWKEMKANKWEHRKDIWYVDILPKTEYQNYVFWVEW